ncbi:hypothetical protein [Spiroplasma endosymbiont of Acasis viretata]|uniref:hypothetical protein n=1 Tax=Spiroplasma endosymbiont of Acasis viretata TaxID=3066306 RepID=UPI00313C83E0
MFLPLFQFYWKDFKQVLRQIRISHYKIGLMEQGIYFHFKPEQMIITDNQELKLNNLWVFLHNYDENKHLPNSFFNINTTIKYQVK